MWAFSVAIICFGVVFLIIPEATGFTYIKQVQSKDGKCLDDDGNEHDVDETWFGSECTRHTCSQQGDEFYEGVAGCGKYGVAPGCHLEDGTGDYPECCPHPVCGDEE
uniref:SLPTX16 n=1 Tax=Scolopendra viridis TaxID=118503 RepID=A0A4D5R9H0_SCOVI